MVPSCSLQVGAGEGQVETTILPASGSSTPVAEAVSSREGHTEL